MSSPLSRVGGFLAGSRQGQRTGPLADERAEARMDRPPSPFVVGVGRCGTTLLRLMIDAHPDLAVPPETHFIPRVIRACRSALEDGRDPGRVFVRVVTSHPTWSYQRLNAEEFASRVDAVEPFDLGEALRTFYRLYAQRFSKHRWGDKTPLYVRNMSLIQGPLPEARFVHLVRDGRDVALSYRDVWFGPKTVEDAATRWRDWIGEARSQAQSLDHYLELRYEDLVSQPEATLKKVCGFVDLPFDPAMLRYHETAEERMGEIDSDVLGPDGEVVVRGEERGRIHAFTRMPPQRERAGRWRREMAEEDRGLFEEIAGDTLREFGYETG